MPDRLEEPAAGRPYMPDYGLRDAGEGILPWSWAVERLRRARNYWLATARPDGRPHLMPIWGVWLDGCFYFSTGAWSRKAKNLAANASCAVSVEDAAAPVVLEGRAARVLARDVLLRFVTAYSDKYSWPMQVTEGAVADQQGDGGPVFQVTPRTAFGFGADLQATATRWKFE